MTIRIGFYGAGPTNAYGNSCFRNFALQNGVKRDNLYLQRDGPRALANFFRSIDINKNRRLTRDEIHSLDLEVYGYSWGAIAAIGFCQKISGSGTIVVGGTPRSPIILNLDCPIPVQRLLVFDPVSILNPPGTVPASVKRFENYYQRNGGDGVLRLAMKPDTIVQQLGSDLSRLLKGMRVDSKAEKSDQHNIAAPDMSAKDAMYFARGSETNHDTIVWFATNYMAA